MLPAAASAPLRRPLASRLPRWLWLVLVALGVATLGRPAPALAESAGARAKRAKAWRAENPLWRGVHLALRNDAQVTALMEELPKFRSVGVNVLVVEVNYGFDFKKHPELRDADFVTKPKALELAGLARSLELRLIPQLNCLGHQSWSRTTGRLLTAHPELINQSASASSPSRFPLDSRT